MKRNAAAHPARRAAQRGLSIVELMVGITIALFILAGATLVLTTQLDSNRRLLLEAQLQQDLRTTADMISRDVRRAGYWGKAYCSIWPAAAPASSEESAKDPANCSQPNPYTRIVPDAAPAPDGTTQLVYDRSTDFEGGAPYNTDDGAVDGGDATRPRERVGFRLNQTTGAIEYMVGANNWQALTDAAVMQVTQFRMVLNRRVLPAPCADADCPKGPQCDGLMSVQSRDLTITIVAQAVHDARVQRSVSENVRLRNSLPVEQCP
jgi:type IV pilus assembly protein PilW